MAATVSIIPESKEGFGGGYSPASNQKGTGHDTEKNLTSIN